VLTEFPDKVRLVYKDFPLAHHADAQSAAEAARCAGEHGRYWDYHDLLFVAQPALSRTDLIAYASRLACRRTPSRPARERPVPRGRRRGHGRGPYGRRLEDPRPSSSMGAGSSGLSRFTRFATRYGTPSERWIARHRETRTHGRPPLASTSTPRRWPGSSVGPGVLEGALEDPDGLHKAILMRYEPAPPSATPPRW
jgi:hypothetical protein